MPQQKLREIEQSTCNQSKNSLWYSVRQYRLTASYFGSVYHRKPTTPPHSLVLQILGLKQFTSDATEWDKNKESIALERYVQLQHNCVHPGLYCCPSGFLISEDYPFLGVSSDAVVHDPTSVNPFSLVEIKFPYSVHNVSQIEAAESGNFFVK